MYFFKSFKTDKTGRKYKINLRYNFHHVDHSSLTMLQINDLATEIIISLDTSHDVN